jgi:hypothetical protein
MNSSAKLTVVTLLAAAALGVAVISACTINSTTSNDTDGGLSSTSSTTSGGTTSSSGSTTSSGGTTSSSGSTTSSSGDPAACVTKQDAGTIFDPPACQTCLQGHCCSELTTCFNIAGDSTHFDCNDYSDCVASECDHPDAGDNCGDSCNFATGGDGGAAGGGNGVVDAYQAILHCGAIPTNCQTVCGF